VTAQVVYRSNHPDALAHRDMQPKLYEEWRSKVEGVLTAFGFPQDSSLMLRGQAFVGVVFPQDKPLPEGWRRDRAMPEAIVPARRTTPGRKAAKLLDDLPQPDPRDHLPGGMPRKVFAAAGMALMSPGLDDLGGYVVVTWSDEMEKPTADRIDPAVWERVKLSEYWAMRETAEAETGDAS
jgi:hypothetical protein